MIHILGGGSPKNPTDYCGRKIVKAEQVGDELHISFEDGVAIRIFDGGQSCCESRYMRTDDDLKSLAGKTLVAIDENLAKSNSVDESGEVHEMAFLDVKTNDGLVSFSFHNEHNGYYGGFGLSLDEIR